MIYAIANIIFLPISPEGLGKPKLWMKSCYSGELFTNDLWTEQEILDKYPDIKKGNRILVGQQERSSFDTKLI